MSTPRLALFGQLRLLLLRAYRCCELLVQSSALLLAAFWLQAGARFSLVFLAAGVLALKMSVGSFGAEDLPSGILALNILLAGLWRRCEVSFGAEFGLCAGWLVAWLMPCVATPWAWAAKVAHL